MKLTFAKLIFGAFLLALPFSGAIALAASPWSGHWTIIHIDPTLPLGQMKISQGGHGLFKLHVEDVQDHVFCPGQPVEADGIGNLTDTLHMTAIFQFKCFDSGLEGEMTLFFRLSLTNPNGIYEIIEDPGTGRVWTRPAGCHGCH